MNFSVDYPCLTDIKGDCFAGCNSGSGFVNGLNEIIDEKRLKRLYIL